MALTADTCIKDGYLLVTLSGSHDLDRAKDMFVSVLHQCMDGNLAGILFDVRGMEGDIPLADRYTFGEFLGLRQPRAIRTAFLATPAQFWSDKFLESVAVNRGALVKTTMDPDEARAWLVDDGPGVG